MLGSTRVTPQPRLLLCENLKPELGEQSTCRYPGTLCAPHQKPWDSALLARTAAGSLSSVSLNACVPLLSRSPPAFSAALTYEGHSQCNECWHFLGPLCLVYKHQETKEQAWTAWVNGSLATGTGQCDEDPLNRQSKALFMGCTGEGGASSFLSIKGDFFLSHVRMQCSGPTLSRTKALSFQALAPQRLWALLPPAYPDLISRGIIMNDDIKRAHCAGNLKFLETQGQCPWKVVFYM